MTRSSSRPRKAEGYSATVLPDGRWLLYKAASQEAITLNAPAGILWELCDGHTPLTKIVEQLRELYPNTPVEILEQETQAMLTTLVERGLVADHAR